MKVFRVAFICSSVTAFMVLAEDWESRHLQRISVIGNTHATVEQTYQSILQYDHRRAEMLQDQLSRHHHRLEDHESGHRKLQKHEHEALLRKINVFSYHLHTLLSESHDEKMEKVDDARHSLFNAHRNDYIDYDKTGI